MSHCLLDLDIKRIARKRGIRYHVCNYYGCKTRLALALAILLEGSARFGCQGRLFASQVFSLTGQHIEVYRALANTGLLIDLDEECLDAKGMSVCECVYAYLFLIDMLQMERIVAHALIIAELAPNRVKWDEMQRCHDVMIGLAAKLARTAMDWDLLEAEALDSISNPIMMSCIGVRFLFSRLSHQFTRLS